VADSWLNKLSERQGKSFSFSATVLHVEPSLLIFPAPKWWRICPQGVGLSFKCGGTVGEKWRTNTAMLLQLCSIAQRKGQSSVNLSLSVFLSLSLSLSLHIGGTGTSVNWACNHAAMLEVYVMWTECELEGGSLKVSCLEDGEFRQVYNITRNSAHTFTTLHCCNMAYLQHGVDNYCGRNDVASVVRCTNEPPAPNPATAARQSSREIVPTAIHEAGLEERSVI